MQPGIVSLVSHLGKGGTERQLFLLTTYLAARGFSCDVIVFNQSANRVYDDPLRAAGVGVWHVPAACQRIPAKMRWIYGKLRQLRPAIVHSWTVHDNPYAGLVGRLAAVPVRWGSLRSSVHHAGFRRLPAFFRLLALYSVSKVIVNSDKARRELQRHYRLSARRIALLPNCVAAEENASAAGELHALGIAPHHLLIGFVGNLRAVKNPVMFIEVMARLIAKRPEARGVLIGQPIPSEPEMEKRLEARIAALGLERKVVLAGFRDNVMAFMRHFDALAITSRSEGMPNVLLEAMAVGCPVVATRVGGIPEIIKNGENGLLVTAGDVAGFAAAVERLLSDKTVSARLGTAGRDYIEKYHRREAVGDRLIGMYTTALEKVS